MNADAYQRLAALAARQCHAFSVAQAAECGISEEDIRLATKAGFFVRVAPGVHSFPGIPDSWPRRLWVAHLTVGPQSAVSHEASAEAHAVRAIERDQVTLLTPHGVHQRADGAVVHQTRDPWPPPLVEIPGLPPVVSVEETFVNLAATTSRLRLRQALLGAIDDKLTTADAVGRRLADVTRRGKPGVQMLTQLIDEVNGDEVDVSELEKAARAMFRRFGGPQPEWEHPHPARQPGRARIDACLVEPLIILEFDGRTWHDRLLQSEDDKKRDADAAVLGWQTLRLLWGQVKGDPEGTWNLIQDTRRVRLRQFGLEG